MLNGVKAMTNHQSSEDYLETILLLSQELKYVHQIDVARRIGVSQPAVKKAMNLLIAGGYITMDGLHIRLTESGEKYAKEVYFRHCTIKSFLIGHGVSEQTADGDACEIEHIISSETIEMMKTWLENNAQSQTENAETDNDNSEEDSCGNQQG